MDKSAKNILIVDDDDLLVRSIEFALERKGYSVRVATNGREAFEMLLAAAPDAIVLDIFMPEMDGLEVLRRMRAEHPEIPIYVISGGGTKELYGLLSVADAFGAAGSLRKPFAASELIALIERRVESRRKA